MACRGLPLRGDGMFNKYIWENYLESGGERTVEIFQSVLEGEIDGKIIEIYSMLISGLRSVYCPIKELVYEECFSDSIQEYVEGELFEDLYKNELWSINMVMRALYKALGGKKGEEKRAFEDFVKCIGSFTTYLYRECSELFVPYYFYGNFNILTKIFDEFGVEMPVVPLKKDYKDRFFFYGEICEALYEFRIENELSPAELCAFLYDFAPKYIGGIKSYIADELPKPKRAFFVGGNPDDFYINEDVTIWECSPETKVGDMAVMYLKTPVSAVDSVWRCVSDGFVDPFFFYYKCAYISKKKNVKRLSEIEMRSDDILGEMPIVRKNMQGFSGVEILPSKYNRIAELCEADVPRIKYTSIRSGVELSDEHDVEEKLIKKLIADLGYSEEQYTRQLHIEIGNHNAMIIPDFLLLHDKTRGHQRAFAVIEAKYEIYEKELEEVEIQVRSYARQVLARYSVIVSKDLVMVYSVDDDFTKSIFKASWKELNNADRRLLLYKLIGYR